MPKVYVVNSYVFVKVREDADGTGYYDIINPSGTKIDYAHGFSSTDEINEYVIQHSI